MESKFGGNIKAPFGVVDMGSNGIRFGIVSALARHLPVEYEERAPIALLDAQGDERIIPSDVMDQVITSFLRFKTLCKNANVQLDNVRVIATEATRVAANSEEFMERIMVATGWEVSLLSKQEEALISASGIVGSFSDVNGLTMDLGGGSVEVSYVLTTSNTTLTGEDKSGSPISVSQHPVSLPYGAAALKRRLMKCKSDQEVQDLYKEIVSELKKAHDEGKLPKSLLNKDGYKVFMSGGGFRALGYLSMAVRANLKPRKHNSRHRMYPIPIINGYCMTGSELKSLADHYKNKTPDEMMKKLKVFRVSKRRAGMIPASCFLVSAILEVFKIRTVYFSEGGVRQGLCYQLLSAEEQNKDPLLEGVKAYAAQSNFALSSDEFDSINTILTNALPDVYMSPHHPLQLHRLLPAAIHLSNLTSHYPKETRAFVAFQLPLSAGPLSNVPGLLHRERAILAILLAYRQGGSIPDPIFYSVQAMVGRKGISVCKYIGRLMELVFAVSPLLPGIGLAESGLSFTTVVPASADASNNNSESDSDSSPPSDEEDEENDNDEGGVEDPSYFPAMQLQITLPERHSPLVDAPAVMSVIESFDKKIKSKKFDMDEDRRPLNCPALFSVEIIRK
ncbi:actin-like ATPase domain-containing protein [Backusella circina FSU 941]|nr:actin-like ATPase domain-containing protein [Backusella circina FSU 941]